MLTPRSFDAPVIHVMSESPRLEMLQTRLRQAGLRPVPVRGHYLPPDAAPIFLDLTTRPAATVNKRERILITLGKDGAVPAGTDIQLNDINQIATLAARIAIRDRENRRNREIGLRKLTSSRFGAAVEQAPLKARPRLLWLGQDAPFLNGLKSCLNQANVDLVAALSCLTAEDYLSSGRFDTLVLCPTRSNGEALRLLSRIKSLPQVTPPHIVLLLRPDSNTLASPDQAANADLIIDLTDDVEALAERLQQISLSQTSRYSGHQGVTTPAQDRASGLASKAFLEAHLEAQMLQADELSMPLTLLALTLDSPKEAKETAEMIKPLLRETDLASRLDAYHICVTLPETHYRGAVSLARRIEEKLGQQVEWRAIERRSFHTLKTLIGGLTAKPGFKKRHRA